MSKTQKNADCRQHCNRRFFYIFMQSTAYKSATISQYKSGIVTTDNTVLLRV